jgi:hypothetical protein
VPALAHKLAGLIGPFQNAAPLIKSRGRPRFFGGSTIRPISAAKGNVGLRADVLQAWYSFGRLVKSTLTDLTRLISADRQRASLQVAFDE